MYVIRVLFAGSPSRDTVFVSQGPDSRQAIVTLSVFLEELGLYVRRALTDLNIW
jgi:hypothetical protein